MSHGSLIAFWTSWTKHMSNDEVIVQLREDLIRDEGLRLKPYRDSVNKTTIGVGRNLDDVGITEKEAEYLLSNDISLAMMDLNWEFPWFKHISDNRKRALANMAFNLGMTRLLGFKKMLKAMAEEDFETAADEALNSKWSAQVGNRAQRIAELLRNG